MLVVKLVHISTVVFSLIAFVWRWRLLVTSATAPSYLKWLPHLNDTLLFVSGITLAWVWGFNPLEYPWLAGKIILLLLYIYLGAKTLHHLRKNGREKRWGTAALTVYACIILLAVLKPGMGG